MGSLRVNALVEGEEEQGRRDLLIHIPNTSQFFETLLFRAERKLPYYESPSEDGEPSSRSLRRLTLVDRECDRKRNGSWFEQVPSELPAAEGKAVSIERALASDGSESSSTSSAEATSVESEEAAIRRHRQQSLEILEGTRRPVPNRDHSGKYRAIFNQRADEEEQEREYIRRRVEGAESLPPPLQGWRFLRDAIVGGLNEDNAKHFPAHTPFQQALLLRIEEVQDKGRVREVHDLDKYSRTQIRKLMAGVAKRGWRDVLWVKNAGEKMPEWWTSDKKMPEWVSLKPDAQDLFWQV